MAMITLKEYAERLKMNPVVVRHKAERGGFQTATKLGRDWIIDEDEPYTDGRVKSGKYIGFREKLKKKDGENTSDSAGE